MPLVPEFPLRQICSSSISFLPHVDGWDEGEGKGSLGVHPWRLAKMWKITILFFAQMLPRRRRHVGVLKLSMN